MREKSAPRSIALLDDDREQEETPDEEKLREISDQVQTALDVLKCLRGFSSITYQEGEAMVTHYEWHVRDLKK
jgi:hypothetical protein